MRVVLFGASGHIGGAERVLLDCARVGDGFPGARVSMVTLADGPLVAAAKDAGAHAVVVAPSARLSALGDSFASARTVLLRALPAVASSPAFLRRLSRALASLAPDLIHTHGIKTHVLAALLPSHAPLIWHVHDYIGMRPVSARLLRLLSRRCALVIAVSDSVAADARAVLPGTRVTVVHNSVDTESFRPDGPAADLDALAGLPPAPAGTVRIGLPATFARWKGQETFLNALARLDRPQVRGYVIGAPLYATRDSQVSMETLTALASQLGLDGRIGFTGLITDMPAAYRALDVVVHASTRPEPFGLVLVEAMACGRALVAVADGGSGELFVNEQHALAATAGDPASLARALARLVDNGEERVAMGGRARAHVVERFGQDGFAANLRSALGAVLPLTVGADAGAHPELA